MMAIGAVIMFMSGRQDGTILEVSQSRNGTVQHGTWSISVGRREDNDLILKYDTFVSRKHAMLHFENGHWNLEDCNSTNGTFVENPHGLFSDQPVTSRLLLTPGQLFRVGRTWLRIQIMSENHDNIS
jgi:pSer/pThr/pTyr-binding forkhead associated (FHA) protein